MKKIAYLSLLIFSALFTQAQSIITVRGTVVDSTKLSVIGAAVKLATATDTILTSTNIDGGFVFNNVKSNQFSITVTSLGYQIAKRNVVVKPNVKQEILSPFIIKNDSRMLNEIVINGTPDVTVKEDTLQYRADAYKLKENALAEDLLKKLPGVEVDKDGNVTAQGKTITKIRINGKDFFGGDVKTATQQLPADVIKNVQVIDDYGDQANITGVKDGDADKILNFTIREDKNKGFLTRGVIGGGNNNRYQGSVFTAGFNNNRQLALLANFNNINANVFNLTNTGSSRRRGSSPEGGDGLTNVNSIGFNYRDSWGKKVTAYGSYSFSNKDNSTTSSNLQTILTQDNTFYNNNYADANSLTNGHRFDFNIEYKIDSLNYLKISPNFRYNNSNGDTFTNFDINTAKTTSIGTSNELTDYTKPNYGADILYNHRFGAKARNLSLNANFNSSSTNQNQNSLYQSMDSTANGKLDTYQKQLIFGDNKNNNVEFKVSYQEPLTATKNLEFNYTYGFARADNDRRVESTELNGGTPTLDPDQSNQYQFDYITNRFGLNYRVNERKYNYSVGFSAQPSVLKSNAIDPESNTTVPGKSVTNLFPSARFSYKFSKTRELSFRYDGQSNQPDYSQLQPITDQSNKNFYVTGNPFLSPEFTNNMRLRYANFDFASQNVLFANLSYSSTKNKITTNTISFPNPADSTVLRENRYLNTDGYYNVNGFYAFSKPFQEKKYVLRFRGSAIYNNNISFIDGAKNTGKNLILSQRIGLQINPVEWFEFTPEATYTYNKNANTLNLRANTEVNSLGFNIDTKIYFLKTWIFGGTLDKTFNNGYSTISSNPLIINSYLEKQFLKGKKASFKLQAFDILDQSTSLSYAATGNTTTLSESNRLARYFMLSFTFNFSKFAGNSNSMPDMGDGGYRRHN